MIELKEFEFPAKDCFRLMIRYQTSRFFLILSLLSVFFIVRTLDVFWFLVCVAASFVVLAVIVVAKTYFLVFTKNNNVIFQKRKFVFDHSMVKITSEDGSENQIPISNIIRVDQVGQYYQLFTSQMGYYPISRSAFQSEEDRERFETEILGNKLQKQTPLNFKLLFLCIFLCLLVAGIVYKLLP